MTKFDGFLLALMLIAINAVAIARHRETMAELRALHVAVQQYSQLGADQ